MRFTWLSNAPWAATGYGVQTKLVVPRLVKNGHEVAVIAYYGLGGAVLNWNGLTCFPGLYHPYGFDVMSPHTMNWHQNANKEPAKHPPVMLTNFDSWVMDIRAIHPSIKWIAWYPVDHDPIPAPVRNAISQAAYRICMSKDGVRQTREAGLDCYYVPLGVDTQIYQPMDKTEARELTGLPKDAYIVGTVAMNKGNPSRKCFFEMMAAFAAFKRKHSSAVYYLHTMLCDNGENQGVPMSQLCNYHGLQIGKDVIFADQYNMTMGYPEERMRALYAAMDVHLLVTMGEGFGVPLIEAQACGTPVITGDWTANRDLCFSGRKVERKDASQFYTGLNATQFAPHPRAIEIALEAEYRDPSSRERARRLVMEYDIENIMQNNWLPTLKAIEEELCH